MQCSICVNNNEREHKAPNGVSQNGPTNPVVNSSGGALKIKRNKEEEEDDDTSTDDDDVDSNNSSNHGENPVSSSGFNGK